jgi:hypothetical protein
VDGDEGGFGKSILSRPPASSVMSSSSSSVEGKKLRKRALACHFEAFLNSIHASILPGRDNVGSSRSRWFNTRRTRRNVTSSVVSTYDRLQGSS